MAAQHGLEAHSHGNVPIQTRSERPRSTSVSDFPELSNRQEIWRYVPLDKLRGLDKEVMGELSESEVTTELASGTSMRWLTPPIRWLVLLVFPRKESLLQLGLMPQRRW